MENCQIAAACSRKSQFLEGRDWMEVGIEIELDSHVLHRKGIMKIQHSLLLSYYAFKGSKLHHRACKFCFASALIVIKKCKSKVKEVKFSRFVQK